MTPPFDRRMSAVRMHLLPLSIHATRRATECTAGSDWLFRSRTCRYYWTFLGLRKRDCFCKQSRRGSPANQKSQIETVPWVPQIRKFMQDAATGDQFYDEFDGVYREKNVSDGKGNFVQYHRIHKDLQRSLTLIVCLERCESARST